MKLDIPKFDTLKEKIAFMIENQDKLIAQKCAAIKYADGISIFTRVIKSDPFKSTPTTSNPDELKVRVVINTTGIMDSHEDVHAKGIWNKSLKENKRIMHLQEHKSNDFSKIISSGDDLKVFVKTYSWKELGYDAEGDTQALVFDSTIKRERNEFMFNQYKNGWVDNHSVGMRYTKLRFAVNDEDYPEEKTTWDDHIDEVVNREEAEKRGYFWYVPEAKVIEGSSVPNGSNPVTPTVSMKNEVGVDEESKEMKAMKAFLNIK